MKVSREWTKGRHNLQGAFGFFTSGISHWAVGRVL